MEKYFKDENGKSYKVELLEGENQYRFILKKEKKIDESNSDIISNIKNNIDSDVTFDIDKINRVTIDQISLELSNNQFVTFSELDLNSTYNKIIHQVKWNPALLIIQLLLNFSSLWLSKVNVLNANWFCVVQILIPLIVYVLGFLLHGNWSKLFFKEFYNEKTFFKLDFALAKRNIIVRPNRSGYSHLFIILLVVLTSFYIERDALIHNQTITGFVLYFLYLPSLILTYLVYRNFSLPIFVNLNVQNDTYHINHDEIDENDVQIAKLQIEVDSLKQKIDTYTIESALLGALAISAYLAVFQAKVLDVSKIHKLKLISIETFNQILHFQFFTGFNTFYSLLFDFDFLWLLILIGSVICSILYLLLLVSRNRIHKQISEMEKNLQLGTSFNEKEENINNMLLDNPDSKILKDRLNKLSVQCDEHLRICKNLSPSLENSFSLLDGLRKMATVIFFLLICVSSCMLSPKFGIVFLFVFLLFELVFFVDAINSKRNIKNAYESVDEKASKLFIEGKKNYLRAIKVERVLYFFHRKQINKFFKNILTFSAFIIYGLPMQIAIRLLSNFSLKKIEKSINIQENKLNKNIAISYFYLSICYAFKSTNSLLDIYAQNDKKKKQVFILKQLECLENGLDIAEKLDLPFKGRFLCNIAYWYENNFYISNITFNSSNSYIHITESELDNAESSDVISLNHFIKSIEYHINEKSGEMHFVTSHEELLSLLLKRTVDLAHKLNKYNELPSFVLELVKKEEASSQTKK